MRLSLDRRSAGQTVLVLGHNLGPATNFSFSSIEFIFRHLRSLFWAVLSDERMDLDSVQ
jgi:hypothetical protein